MKLLSAEQTMKYKEYHVTSKLDNESVHEFMDVLIEKRMLFKISGSATKAISIPTRIVEIWGEKFNVVVSGEMVHIEHLTNLGV